MPEINPYEDTESLIHSLSLDDSLLDILIEVEDILDQAHVYAYRNWRKGVVCKGPDITRHWVKFSLKYKYNEMPDPEAAKRLTKMNIVTEYERAIIEVPREIKEPDDVDQETGEAKIDEEKVWFVHMDVPREFVENVRPSADEGILPMTSKPEDPKEENVGYGT